MGALLPVTGTSHGVDGHVALAVSPGDRSLTSDPGDLERMLARRGIEAVVVRV